MEQQAIRKLAEYLNKAEMERQEVMGIQNDYPELTIQDSYSIMEELAKIKLEAGHRAVGFKLGLTSKQKMKQIGLNKSSYGILFDYMAIDSGGSLPFNELIHPRVEPEIGIIMGKDLKGPNVTKEEAMAAIAYVVPAMEIIDSRYINFKFTAVDAVADNSSSARFILGAGWKNPQAVALDLIGVTLMINGQIVDSGTGAEVLDHPANAVVMLANLLAEKNKYIPANSLILTGAITKSVYLKPGDIVSTRFEDVGEVNFCTSK
jgi:2-oxo-3-hexenedioate decarboxylase